MSVTARGRARALLILALTVAITAACSGRVRDGGAADAAASLAPLDPRQVQRGREVYRQSCATCHGPTAKGTANWQQPDARGNLPPPPHDDNGHTWRHGDTQLAEIIRDGMRDRFNKTPELTMPAFGDRLTDDEIAAVIAYFKSLWAPEHRQFQEGESLRPAMEATPTAPPRTVP